MSRYKRLNSFFGLVLSFVSIQSFNYWEVRVNPYLAGVRFICKALFQTSERVLLNAGVDDVLDILKRYRQKAMWNDVLGCGGSQ